MPSTLSTRGSAFYSTTPNSTFCPEDFAGDENLMIEAAEKFSRQEVLPVLDRLDAQEEGLAPALIRKAGELGFCGIDSPEAYGGLGLGKNLAARILEYLSLNSSFSVTVGITSGISQVGLALFGTEEQKAKYIPRLAAGEWIGAYALSEPNSGSDALSATTKAVRHGDKWRLSGSKMWISNAKWADFFLVMAKVDGERFSAFLVERDTPGLSVAREEHKMGLKGSSTARLELNDAEIPLENLLHEEGKGHQVAFNALNLGRFKLASMSIGPARDAIGLAAAYALDRKQFGRPISDFGLIRQKFALMAANFFVAESMIYRTGALIDEAFAEFAGTIDGNRKAAEENAVECSLCKVFATEAEAFIIDEALQCFGGYGFTEEYGIARHYRDARVSRIYEGTNEINRAFASDRLRRKIKDGSLPAASAGDSFISDLAGKAMAIETSDQIQVGAASDLLILAYAEQSARLRAARFGGLATELYHAFLNVANAKAAQSYQLLTGDPVSLPSLNRADLSGIAEAVLAAKAPLSFH